jgi:hypothetical protein
MTRPVSVPILMYHALSGFRTPGFRRWTLSADRFEAHLDYLKDNGLPTAVTSVSSDMGEQGGLPGDPRSRPPRPEY